MHACDAERHAERRRIQTKHAIQYGGGMCATGRGNMHVQLSPTRLHAARQATPPLIEYTSGSDHGTPLGCFVDACSIVCIAREAATACNEP